MTAKATIAVCPVSPRAPECRLAHGPTPARLLLSSPSGISSAPGLSAIAAAGPVRASQVPAGAATRGRYGGSVLRAPPQPRAPAGADRRLPLACCREHMTACTRLLVTPSTRPHRSACLVIGSYAWRSHCAMHAPVHRIVSVSVRKVTYTGCCHWRRGPSHGHLQRLFFVLQLFSFPFDAAASHSGAPSFRPENKSLGPEQRGQESTTTRLWCEQHSGQAAEASRPLCGSPVLGVT